MVASATHASPFSGTWYPGDPDELAELLDELWRTSEERTGGSVHPGAAAYVTPHAGLRYSGVAAASVYRRLQAQEPRRVILAGFSHRGSGAGIEIPDIEAYSTALGRVEIDVEMAEALTGGGPPFQRTPEASLCDHSVEIQLPLLQKAAPNARIVPLYVGRLNREERRAAALRLAELLSPETVLVASSDLTHYGANFGFKPFPIHDAASGALRNLDFEVMEAAGSLRDEFFLEALRETGATVCGYDPIALLLTTVKSLDSGDEIFQDTLDYQVSGEITGDFHSSVSYGALGYFRYSSLELDSETCAAVVGLARRTLADYQRTGSRRIPALAATGVAGLQRRAGLFVTLHRQGHLRGCVGRTAACQSLERAIPELTMAAALEDSRFDPVSVAETDLEVEVSVLSPMKRILDRADFRVNEHGAMLRARGRRGLLLPQVATERNWDAAQFFQALAEKSGVKTEAYDDRSAQLNVFRAQVIR